MRLKLEWLNEEYTRARITRGVVKRLSAIVYLSDKYSDTWYYEKTTRRLEDYLEDYVRLRRRDQLLRNCRKQEWQPAAKLPVARVVDSR